MMKIAMRGLRDLACRFDAWMTEKPKALPTDKAAKLEEVFEFLDDAAFSRHGGLRKNLGTVPHQRWLDP